MATELHLKKVLNIKQNIEDAFKTHLMNLGFANVFTSVSSEDMPEDAIDLTFDVQRVDSARAATAARTQTGQSEYNHYVGTLTVVMRRVRLDNNGNERQPSDAAFSTVIYEDLSKIKYAFLMGSIAGTFNGIAGVQSDYYALTSAVFQGEQYGMTEDGSDVATITYELGLYTKETAWAG